MVIKAKVEKKNRFRLQKENSTNESPKIYQNLKEWGVGEVCFFVSLFLGLLSLEHLVAH